MQSAHQTARPEWDIDRVLAALVGCDVRVAAEAFAPIGADGQPSPAFIGVQDLLLPDNTRPEGRPVFFEGKLRQFTRQIGVVHVWLDAPSGPTASAQGVIYFRGGSAVLVHGPAVVRLAFPFRVERLPCDEGNYLRDLRFARVQFDLSLA